MYGPKQNGAISIEQVIEIAHKNNLPVIVDAAALLPPIENLMKFTNLGADLVAFSGGKGLRGPQSTGILCGKKELIKARRLFKNIGLGYKQPLIIPKNPNLFINEENKCCLLKFSAQ